MRKFNLVLFTIISVCAFSQSDMNFENKLFEVYEPGSSNSTLMNINGDKLITYPRGNCKIRDNYAIVNLFGNAFLYDSNGEVFSYNEIYFLKYGNDNDKFVVRAGDNYGIVDKSGNVIIPFIYDYIFTNTISKNNDKFVVRVGDNYGIVDKSGNVIIPIIYDYIFPESTFKDENLIFVRKNNKVGIINIESNEVVVPIDYDIESCEAFYETDYASFKLIKNGKKGLVDIDNRIIAPFKYDKLWADDENELSVWDNAIKEWKYLGLAISVIGEKEGIIDIKTGKEVIPCIYDDLIPNSYNPNLLEAKINGKYGVIDYKGNIIVPFEYEYVRLYNYDDLESDIFATKRIGEKKNITIFDIHGKKRISGIEDYKISWYNYELQNFYVIKRNGKWEIVDIKTLDTLLIVDRMLSDSYHSYDVEHHFLTPYNNNNLRAIFDINKRKYITEFSYTDIDFSKDGKYAFCKTPNHLHNCIINLEDGTKKNLPEGYTVDGYSYGGNLFRVMYFEDHQAVYGVINKKGDIVLPVKYHSNCNRCTTVFFENGFIRVAKVGIFDKNGMILLSGNYSEISKCDLDIGIDGDLMLVEKYDSNKNEYLYGYYIYNDSKMTELLPCIYSEGESIYQLYSYLHRSSRPDVDRNIPVANKTNKNMFAVIIANEKYFENNVSDVRYAINDGKIFKEYCQKTLGIPSANIKFKENASLNQIRYELNWLKDIAEAYNGQAKIIFYYAGHGIPDERNSSAYLLPSDGFGSDIESAYGIDELYSQLGELPAKQITVFMDACFSGAKRDGDMLTSARGVAIKAKSGTPKGNMVVFSAAQGDETAHQYNKKKHGMFTYFLLKKLQETKGEVTIEELAKYIKEQVQKCSVTENGKLQTPTLQLSPEFQTSIKDITL